MADDFNDLEIPVPCHGCGRNTFQRLSWLKAHDEMTCPLCNGIVHLDENGFRDALRDAEKSIARLRSETRPPAQR